MRAALIAASLLVAIGLLSAQTPAPGPAGGKANTKTNQAKGAKPETVRAALTLINALTKQPIAGTPVTLATTPSYLPGPR